MASVIDIAIPAITFLALTAVGLDLTPAHFHQIRGRLIVVTVGLVAPMVVLPVIAVGLLSLFRPAPDVTAGLLLIAACPIGGISNTYSYLARASTALSVVLTTLSVAAAGFTIPVISSGLGYVMGQSHPLTAPPGLVPQLLAMVVLPVVLGMWMRRRWPQAAAAHQPDIQRAAFAALGLLLALIIGSDPAQFTAGLGTTMPLAAAFVVSSMAVGWLVAAGIGASPPDRCTLTLEFATRNVSVATAMAVTLLGHPSFALFAAAYFLTELPIALAAVAVYRWRSASRAVVTGT